MKVFVISLEIQSFSSRHIVKSKSHAAAVYDKWTDYIFTQDYPSKDDAVILTEINLDEVDAYYIDELIREYGITRKETIL